jgi:hypothetical protein
MADLLIDWSEVDRFLQLLGRSADSADAVLYPPKEGPGSDKRAHKLKLDEAGRQEAERLLFMPLYRFHSLGVRPNPGGAKASKISEGVALFMEADGGLSIEAQEAIPSLLGLPEPTFTVWTGGKSLHLYWCAKEGGSLSPQAWRKAQERLIAAVEEVAPEAGVDDKIKNLSGAMRAPGSIHPATGERCRIHSESGERYDLAALVELLPPLPKALERKSSSASTARGGAQEVAKALEALAFLPPLDFTSLRQVGSLWGWVSIP